MTAPITFTAPHPEYGPLRYTARDDWQRLRTVYTVAGRNLAGCIMLSPEWHTPAHATDPDDAAIRYIIGGTVAQYYPETRLDPAEPGPLTSNRVTPTPGARGTVTGDDLREKGRAPFLSWAYTTTASARKAEAALYGALCHWIRRDPHALVMRAAGFARAARGERDRHRRAVADARASIRDARDRAALATAELRATKALLDAPAPTGDPDRSALLWSDACLHVNPRECSWPKPGTAASPRACPRNCGRRSGTRWQVRATARARP